MAIGRERLRIRAVALALLAALVLYGVFLARNAAYAVGGSDSSGYANAARRLLSGTLVARPRSLDRLELPDALAEIVTPLGFIAGPKPATITPFYPLGFPAHLAAAALAGGWEKAPYLVSPIAAVLCLAVVYLLARELGLSPAWSAGTVAALAAWPAFLFQAIQPMGDVVAALWAAAAILFALRARRRSAWALPCGAAVGLAVLVRPTNLVLAVPLALALPWTWRCLGLLVLGGSPMATAQAAINVICYGGLLRSGYGNIGLFDAMALSNFPERIRYYGRWVFDTFTPIVPLAAAVSAADRQTPARARAMLLCWFGVFLAFYCFYGPYESFAFLRFLLPGIPGLLLAAALGMRDALARIPATRPRAAIAVLALAVVLVVERRQTRKVGVFATAEAQAAYPRSSGLAATTLPEHSVVVATIASGALEYYTELPYIRWDPIWPAKWPALRAELEGRGWRFYALLFPEEEKGFAEHVPGAWTKIDAVQEVGLWRLPPLAERINARE